MFVFHSTVIQLVAVVVIVVLIGVDVVVVFMLLLFDNDKLRFWSQQRNLLISSLKFVKFSFRSSNCFFLFL